MEVKSVPVSSGQQQIVTSLGPQLDHESCSPSDASPSTIADSCRDGHSRLAVAWGSVGSLVTSMGGGEGWEEILAQQKMKDRTLL